MRLQQIAGALRRHRFAKYKTLRIFAAELVKLDCIRVGLGTLGDYVHAEIVRECNNRPQDDWPRAFGRRAHKRLVDFDCVERETLEVGKRRIPSAEVIERQTGAE